MALSPSRSAIALSRASVAELCSFAFIVSAKFSVLLAQMKVSPGGRMDPFPNTRTEDSDPEAVRFLSFHPERSTAQCSSFRMATKSSEVCSPSIWTWEMKMSGVAASADVGRIAREKRRGMPPSERDGSRLSIGSVLILNFLDLTVFLLWRVMVASIFVLSRIVIYSAIEIISTRVIMLEAPDGSSEKESKEGRSSESSWIATIVGLVLRHAREVVGGALAVAGTIENDVRSFVIRFVRNLVLGVTFLFLGFGFLVFGVGTVLVEALRLGTATGSIVVGVLFIAVGAALFSFSRR